MSPIDALPSEVKTPVWQSVAWQQMILRQALVALHLYHLDEHYIIAEDKVQIVDDSTGRVMADRSWEQGLHQLIETKEGVELTSGRDTLARMTFQRFFRRYFLLSGLTGTGMEVKRELWSVYRLKVCAVPPNKPKQRKRLQDHCYADFEKKWPLVAQDAIRAAERGQPVLIGTRSVESSEQVSAELMR
jgi:preprotein translocase subunit SecA